MNLKQAQAIANRLRHSGYDAKVRENYSGRFMFGATTHGVVTDAHHSYCPFLYDFRFDNMGKDFIYY